MSAAALGHHVPRIKFKGRLYCSVPAVKVAVLVDLTSKITLSSIRVSILLQSWVPWKQEILPNPMHCTGFEMQVALFSSCPLVCLHCQKIWCPDPILSCI